jgi:hypothetical protein
MKEILTFWLWELMVIRVQRFTLELPLTNCDISIPLFIVKIKIIRA